MGSPTWILLSGGIDSAACVQFYADLGRTITCLFVDYGQRAAEPERQSATLVSSHYRVPLNQLVVSGPRTFAQGEVPARNGLLLVSALMHFPARAGTVAIGVHSGTPYYDCTPGFLDTVNEIFAGYTDGRVRCEAPFLDWDKAAIWQYCHTKRVPVEITYSCERGDDPPCGKCLSCLDRRCLGACPPKHS